MCSCNIALLHRFRIFNQIMASIHEQSKAKQSKAKQSKAYTEHMYSNITLKIACSEHSDSTSRLSQRLSTDCDEISLEG